MVNKLDICLVQLLLFSLKLVTHYLFLCLGKHIKTKIGLFSVNSGNYSKKVHQYERGFTIYV